MAQQPQVSVVIPVHNSNEYIEECISSIINQSLQNIEVLFVDGGSTDGTVEKIKKYAYDDKRVKVFLSYKKTLGGLLNHGISISSGRYVTFVNVRNFLEEKMLETLNRLTQTNYIDMIQGSVSLLNSDNNIVVNDVPVEKAFTVKRVPSFVNNYYSIEGILYKRSFLIHKNIRFLEEDVNNIGEYLFQETVLKAATITYTDKICIYQRDELTREDLSLSEFSKRMKNLLSINKQYNHSDKNINNILLENVFEYIRNSLNSSITDYYTVKHLNELFRSVDSEFVRRNLCEKEKHFYYKFKSPLILSTFEEERLFDEKVNVAV